MESSFATHESIVRCELIGRDEIATNGNVALGPFKFVELAEVLDKVAIGLERTFDLTKVNYLGSGEVVPLGFDDGVGKIP